MGVGTVTPAANEASSRLTVSANDSSANYLSIENSGTGQAGLVLRRTGGTASRWVMHAGAGSPDLLFYNGADRLRLSAAGVLTASGLDVGAGVVTAGGIILGNETLSMY